MRVIFMGTPSFAVPVLEKLVESKHEVVAAVTQPDRRNARGKTLPSPVKAAATEKGLPVFQFEKISNEYEALKPFSADVMVTAAYGQILSDAVLNLTPKGVLNVHASLLPKYRGSSPVQWALINGEKETGVTVMQTVREVDAGDMLSQTVLPLDGTETADVVLERLSHLGANLLVETLDKIEESGTAEKVPQNVAIATFCRMLAKEDGYLKFAEFTAEEIKNRVRGVTPSPSAYFFSPHGRIKVFNATVAAATGIAGTVLSSEGALQVACKEGSVIFEELQGENARRMPAADYLRGKPIEKGTMLS